MPESNIPEAYERTVKIKDLPVKEDITLDSVLLIEDDEDTKQMSVKKFYDLIDNISARALEAINAKIEEVNTYMEYVKETVKDLEDSTILEAEEERQKNEQDRIKTFDQWKSTFENDWTPFINQAKEQEDIRQDNEDYRTTLINQWLEMINQWELAEQDRVSAEQGRVEAEQDRETAEGIREENETNRGTNFNNLTVTINNKITEMNQTIQNGQTAIDGIDDTVTDLQTTINDAIADMDKYFESIQQQITGGLKSNVPVGTTLFSTSSDITFFNTCFGGTWEIIGNVDTTVESTGQVIPLYLFKKISDTQE